MSWKVAIEAVTLSWPSITPFGVPVVPDVKTSSQISSGCGRGRAATSASQSAGMPSSGSAVRVSTVVVGNDSRPTSRGSGASRPVPRISRAALEAATIPSIGVRGHPEVERHQDQSGPDRPEVGGREIGGRRRPGQEPVARVEAERPEPPRGDPRPAIELAIGPGEHRSVVPPHRQGGPIGKAVDGLVQEVEQRGHRGDRSSGPRLRRRAGPSARPNRAADHRTRRPGERQDAPAAVHLDDLTGDGAAPARCEPGDGARPRRGWSGRARIGASVAPCR